MNRFTSQPDSSGLNNLVNQQPERFVDANALAEHLSVTRRQVLEMTRRGIIPGHPLGIGTNRKVGATRSAKWRARLRLALANPPATLTTTAWLTVRATVQCVPAVPLANGGNPMAKGWFRRKNGKLMYFWYNAFGNERSKTLGSATMTDEQGWVKVGELGLGQLVGRPDPVNATFGEVLDH